MESSKAAQWYLQWCDLKPSLEQLIEKKKEIIRSVHALSLERNGKSLKTFNMLLETKSSLNESLAKYSEVIGRQEAEIVLTAQEIVREGLVIAQQRASPIKITNNLESLVQQWNGSRIADESDALLKGIFWSALLYKGMATLTVENSKEFYRDLTSLQSLADEEQAASWIERYALSADSRDLRRIKSDFEQNYVLPLERQRLQLKEKYKKSLFSRPLPEYRLLDALPIKPFRELQEDVARVLSNPEKYLVEKRKIQQEMGRLETEIKMLQGVSTTDPADVDRLSTLSPVALSFKDFGTLFLRESIRHYTQKLQEYNNFITKKKIEMSNTIFKELEQTDKRLEEEVRSSSLYHAALSKIEAEIREANQKLVVLGQQGTPLIKSLEMKIARLRADPPYPEEEEKYMMEIEALPPLRNLHEVWGYAWEQRADVRDKTLVDYCALISGMKDGKYDARPLQLRLQEATGRKLATVTGKDRVIYERLSTAIRQYF